MAHFAQLDKNNIVLRVVKVSDVDTSDIYNNQVEQIGINFCRQIHGQDTIWKQTSYNAVFRSSFACVGFTYDEDLDAFLAPKPYPSWVLDENNVWTGPIERPLLTDEQFAQHCFYRWNEDAYQTDNTTGWELVTPE